MPETLNVLKKAYHAGLIYPVYGYAHHTHIALLTEPEIEDEIRLNREHIHDILKVPQPKYPGLFPIEGSLQQLPPNRRLSRGLLHRLCQQTIQDLRCC